MQLNQLEKFKSHGLLHLQGPLNVEISEVKTPDQAHSESLVFVSKQELIELALAKGTKAFIQSSNLKYSWPADITVFTIPSISLGLALVLPLFDKKKSRFRTAQNHTVHPTARIGDNVIIDAYAVIGAHVIIGSGCLIGAHTVIEDYSVIGANTIIHPHVFIGSGSEIGTRCEIHPHTTLGSDGYGYVTDPSNGRHHKVPQIGRVIIEDDVEIGSNCAIDRATLSETRIKSGSKLDNLIHIAHNCEIGENALITASFTMAGSSKLGKQFVCGGQAGVGDHVTICDNVTLTARGAAVNDISEPGTYGGFPAIKLHTHLRITKAIQDLPEIWKSWRRSKKDQT